MFRLCRESLPRGRPAQLRREQRLLRVARRSCRAGGSRTSGIAHFEEPIPYYDLPGLRQVVDALDVPVSSGEFESTRWRFVDLIELGNPDIVQPDILGGGGITELRRIADLATAYNKPVMPH